MEMTERWLDCKVGFGILSTERSVSFEGIGRRYSLLVDERLVQNHRLRVNVLGRWSVGANAVVVALPASTADGATAAAVAPEMLHEYSGEAQPDDVQNELLSAIEGLSLDDVLRATPRILDRWLCRDRPHPITSAVLSIMRQLVTVVRESVEQGGSGTPVLCVAVFRSAPDAVTGYVNYCARAVGGDQTARGDGSSPGGALRALSIELDAPTME